MRRAGKLILAAASIVFGLPLLGVATVMVAGNTEPGRHAIEQLVAKVTDGAVRIDGLSGYFPDTLRARSVTLSDHGGVWLTIDHARLDWSPARLLFAQLAVAKVEASHVSMARLPETSGTSNSTLPIGIAIDDVHIRRFDLGSSIAGTAASVSVNGNLHWTFLKTGSFALDIERLDSAGSYRLNARLAPHAISGRLHVLEPAHGLLSSIAGLPNLGPLSIAAAVEGPRSAEHVKLLVSAGDLNATGDGTIDLVEKILDINLAATARTMAPRRELRWKSARLNIRLNGTFTRPDASGYLDIEALRTSDVAIRKLTANIKGSNGKLDFAAALAGLQIPGPRPDFFTSHPFMLHATALLDTSERSVTFTLSHPLVAASGHINISRALVGSVAVTFPSLGPYATVAGIPLQGNAILNAKFLRQAGRTSIRANGTIGVTSGSPSGAAILGDHATFDLSGKLHGRDVSLEKFEISGRALHVTVAGGETDGSVDFGWQARLSNLSDLTSAMAGTIAAQGNIHGSLHDFAVTARANARLAVTGLPLEPLTASLQLYGLPSAPSGQLDIHGRLAGAPLRLAAKVSRQSDGTLNFLLDHLEWRSASGSGHLRLPLGTSVPLGHIQFRMAHLDELAPLTGLKATGRINVTFNTSQVQGKPEAKIQVELRHLMLNGESVDGLTVDARVADLMTHPVLAATIRVNAIHVGAFTGDARLTAKGPFASLRLNASSHLRTPHGPAALSATAIVALSKRSLRLISLEASFKGETAHLLAPTNIKLATGLSIENFRLAAGGAVITLAGRVTPTLALTLSARNLTPQLARLLIPDLGGSGAIELSGKLHGTLSLPQGTLHLTGQKLEIAKGSFGGAPVADIDATAILRGSTAKIVAQLTAGAVHLRLSGTAPLRQSAPVDLRLSGTTDLDIFDPVLTPNGRAVRGQATLDLGVHGTMARPQLTGTVRLTHGAFQDYVQGIHITDIYGLMRADGTVLRIVQLEGHAGRGTVSCVGTIGILQSQLPIALTIVAHDAQLPASNLLTATTSANLIAQTTHDGILRLSGQIHVSRANIEIPDRFPKEVAVLNVRRLGEKPSAPRPPKQTVKLALAIEAPEQIFVRGHGVDAEMGGTVTINGSSTAPVIGGGFRLRHGTFNFAGQTLNFTTGKISFDGLGLTNKIDPMIDFVAKSTANDVTATLAITGYADAPEIGLSSSPDLPQDEILAHLLFGQSVKQLSPFQIAEIAQGIASLSGVGGTNPLAAVRKGLGLDRLTVSSASGGGASAEAGKYIANGIYVGTKQGLSGGTQVQVQINLTKRLKLESTLAASGTQATGATPNNDPGSSVGLSYQFEY